MPVSRAREQILDETLRSMRRVTAALHARYRGELRRHGITFPQLMVMKHLRQKGRATPKELADALEVTPGNITGVIDRLEREGLVSRARSTEDRRVVYIRLTEEAHGRMAKLIAHAPTLVSDMFEDLTNEDMAQLTALLLKVRLAPEDATDF